MTILLIILVVLVIIVFGLLITGLIIIWCSESKKIEQVNEKLDESTGQITEKAETIEGLQSDIDQLRSYLSRHQALIRIANKPRYQKDMPERIRELLMGDNKLSKLNDIVPILTQANVRLKDAHRLGLPRRERLGTYFYTCFQLFCLALKTLVVTALFGALCALFLGLSLCGVAIILGGAGYPLSEVCCALKVEYVQCIQYALPAGNVSWAALGLAIAVGLVLSVVFLQKVTKLLFIFCDILFEDTRICMRIVCAEKFDRARIIQDITLLTRSVERKNSSGFFNNFLTRFED